MEIYGEISKVRAAVKAWKKEGLTVGIHFFRFRMKDDIYTCSFAQCSQKGK